MLCVRAVLFFLLEIDLSETYRMTCFYYMQISVCCVKLFQWRKRSAQHDHCYYYNFEDDLHNKLLVENKYTVVVGLTLYAV